MSFLDDAKEMHMDRALRFLEQIGALTVEPCSGEVTAVDGPKLRDQPPFTTHHKLGLARRTEALSAGDGLWVRAVPCR
eukprot:SAG11_NODE_17695_length_511_cov_1.007282_2_plen_77_part_01